MIKKMFCALLIFAVCLFACAVSPAEENTFVLRDGITWNTTPNELAEKMNVKEPLVYESNIITTYCLKVVPVSRYEAYMSCIYLDGRMAAILYEFYYGYDMPAAISYLSEALMLKYGEPLESRELFDTNMLALGIQNLNGNDLQNLTSITSWQAPDGTLISLVSAVDNGMLDLLYLNTSRLTGEESLYHNMDGL